MSAVCFNCPLTICGAVGAILGPKYVSDLSHFRLSSAVIPIFVSNLETDVCQLACGGRVLVPHTPAKPLAMHRKRAPRRDAPVHEIETLSVAQSLVWVSLGTSDAPADPRPDSDGFSMKKRWQLNENSPSGRVYRLKLPDGSMTQLCAVSARFAAIT